MNSTQCVRFVVSAELTESLSIPLILINVFRGQGEVSYEGVTIKSPHAGLMNEQIGIAILIAVLLIRSSRRSWLG